MIALSLSTTGAFLRMTTTRLWNVGIPPGYYLFIYSTGRGRPILLPKQRSVGVRDYDMAEKSIHHCSQSADEAMRVPWLEHNSYFFGIDMVWEGREGRSIFHSFELHKIRHRVRKWKVLAHLWLAGADSFSKIDWHSESFTLHVQSIQSNDSQLSGRVMTTSRN